MALTPWPSSPVALATATAELAGALGLDATADAALVQRLGATASALVERFAPGAPAPIRCEATIRTAGWLHEAPSSGARMESVGDISTSWSANTTGALRSSGAMALLSPWKVRRAGVLA